MKGIFFHEGQEFQLETIGEVWKQNEVVSGKVHCKGQCPQNLFVVLAFADFKDVRAKDEKAWDIIEEKKIEGAGTLLSWQIKLAPDAPVTVGSGSLFVLLKVENKIIGHLQLTSEIRPMLKSFIETFELFFRFKTHSFKNRKGGFLEYKMMPPTVREYANMDQVLVALRLKGDQLEAKYSFTLKSLAMVGAGQTELQKKKRDIEQVLTKKDYEFCEGAHNPEGMKKFIAEALSSAAPKTLF